MGRLHLSSAPKYAVKQEPTYIKWADQAFDPEAEVLSGHAMVYEAFLDKDGCSPPADDGDGASELNSELSSSSATTEDLDEYPTLRRVARERLRSPPSPVLSTHSVELNPNDFDDFVRVEVPQSEISAPDTPTVTMPRPSSPLRQSITSSNLDELPDHSPSNTPEVVLQRGDDERLFAYYQVLPEREHLHYVARAVPRMDARALPSARRLSGHLRFLPPVATRLEGQRTPLATPPSANYVHPRPRSASYSEITRVPERWVSTVDGTVISNRVLAQH